MNKWWRIIKKVMIGDQYRVVIVRQKGETCHQDVVTIYARSRDNAEQQAFEMKGIYDHLFILRIDLID